MGRKRSRWASITTRVRILLLFSLAGVVCMGLAIGGYYLTMDDDIEQVALPECQTGPTVPGIDVSYYQETIDWKKVRWAGVKFAFIRISDGTTVIDTRFEENWAGAKSNGVLRGSYQYFRPDQDAIAQADIVIAALRRDPGELAVAIDVENDGGRMPPAKIAAQIRKWLERVRSQLGIEPIIYTGPDFWKNSVGGADIPGRLWLAHYTTACPTVPSPWTKWTFWQHTDSGRVKGIYGKVDLDVFAGTIDELQASRISTR